MAERDLLMTVEGLAKLWHVSTAHIYNLINHRDPEVRLQAIKIGGMYRIRESVVARYLDEHVVEP